ncbi:MAG: FecR family protein [Spirochaetia bacterium]|nr:FecR family protein [Spirochaetia bacterium]
MKKYFTALCVFIFTTSFNPVFAGGAGVYGIISFVSGDVTITSGQKSFPAKIGAKIQVADSIVTGNGIARIQIAGTYICHIEKNTKITFQEILETNEKDSYNINLSTGQILSRLIREKNKKANLTIITPTITAAVRGTDFMVSETEKSAPAEGEKSITTGVYVSQGIVEVESPGREKVNVNAGEEVKVLPGELRKSMMEDFISAKMKILDELKIMKEFNCKLIEEQKEKNRKLLEEMK